MPFFSFVSKTLESQWVYNFLSLLTILESQFLSVAYLMVASLVRFAISVRCWVSARSQYLLRFLSLCLINGGHSIHPSIQRLLPPTVTKPTLFKNFAYKVAGLQVHFNSAYQEMLQNLLTNHLFYFWNEALYATRKIIECIQSFHLNETRIILTEKERTFVSSLS